MAASGAVLTEVRVEVIRILGGRSSSADVATRMAKLIQPHAPLAVRIAVADHLQDSRCEAECVLHVLHYMERLSYGERAWEDVGEDVGITLSEEKERLERQLTSLLLANKGFTLRVLEDIYGLTLNMESPWSSPFPSKFAIQMTSRLKIVDACPILVYIEANAGRYPSEMVSAAATAKRDLKCSDPAV